MIKQEFGKLITYQGDSCNIKFNIRNLSPVELYGVYLQLNFETPIVKKAECTTDNDGVARASFFISKEETEVTAGVYSYALKACKGDDEDTIHTGKLTIKEKVVEGDL